MHLPWLLVDLIENELSEQQRRVIDWYLLKMAIKAKKNKNLDTMHLFIAKWHKSEIQKFGIKSIYHESRKNKGQ